MKRKLILGLFLSPLFLAAQKREELQSIQRDVAQLAEQVKQLQQSQDQKITALEGMLQQVIDASSKAAATAAALQQSVDTKLNDQQRRLAEPIATMGTKVDGMSDDLRSISTNVAELVRKMNALKGGCRSSALP